MTHVPTGLPPHTPSFQPSPGRGPRHGILCESTQRKLQVTDIWTADPRSVRKEPRNLLGAVGILHPDLGSGYTGVAVYQNAPAVH